MNPRNITIGILTTLLVLPLPALAAEPLLLARRPSYRMLRKIGEHNKQDRTKKETYQNYNRNTEKDIRTYTNSTMGILIQYRDDWNATGGITTEDHEFFVNPYGEMANHAMQIVSENAAINAMVMISVFEKQEKQTYDTMAAALDAFVQPPTTHYEWQKRYRYRSYQHLSLKYTTWKGRPALEHTFLVGEPHFKKHVREIIIGAGTRVYSLQFVIDEDQAEAHGHLFNWFLDHFSLLHSTKQIRKSPTPKMNPATAQIRARSMRRNIYRKSLRQQKVSPRSSARSRMLERLMERVR